MKFFGRFDKRVVFVLAVHAEQIPKARSYLFDSVVPWDDDGEKECIKFAFFDLMGIGSSILLLK